MSKTIQTPALTDAQRQLLGAASTHPAAALVLPERLKGKALARVAEALVGKGLMREVRTRADLPVWRQEAETGKRFSLLLTKAGRAAASSAEAPQQGGPSAPMALSAATIAVPAAAQAPSAVTPDTTTEAEAASSTTPRQGSKLSGVIALLRRDTGSSVTELMAATGWLPHTTRAALTGLRKRGFAVTREVAETGSVYRIIEGASTAAVISAAA